MITIRRSEERGHANHGWLDTFHTFSFADYRAPELNGFSVLRVLNQDRVEPGQGFGTHEHKDMEIVSQLLAGTLEHKDSMGASTLVKNTSTIKLALGSGSGSGSSLEQLGRGSFSTQFFGAAKEGSA